MHLQLFIIINCILTRSLQFSNKNAPIIGCPINSVCFKNYKSITNDLG